MQQQYTHTPETFSIFYNETNMTLKDHNDKLIIHNEKIECYKETLIKYEHIINRLETQNTILQEKNSTLEHNIHNLDKYVYDLNRMMLKFFAYGKTPKSLNPTGNTPISGIITTPTPPPITTINATSPFSSYTPISTQDTPQNKTGFTFGNNK